MGPGGLAPRLGVTLDEAKELIAQYFKAYPGVQKWLDKAAKDAVRLGYSVTTLGRKRFYTMPDESLKRSNDDEWRKQVSAIERQGKNSPIQGGNADMTKLALIYLRNCAEGLGRPHGQHGARRNRGRGARGPGGRSEAHRRGRDGPGGEAILKSVPVVADASLADYWSK